MATLDSVSLERSFSRTSHGLPVLFGATILFSACLLFVVQPLAGKLILPWFGGSAAVWIACMLFFQAGLLLGYLYAHLLVSRFAPKQQAIIHVALLGLCLFTLPILPNVRWQPAPGQDPTWNLFAALGTSVGLPYLALSSTSPLLQSWYARSSENALPYRYFALSNAGSLIALFSYPMFIEPGLTGHQQAWTWSVAFVLFAIFCACTAWFSSKVSRFDLRLETASSESAPARGSIFLCIALAACASTLLLAVTNMLTQNIAPMPLLWVIPLGIYLLTFILCFEGDRWYRRWLFLPLLFPALVCLVLGSGPDYNNEKVSLMLPLLSAALFVCCMCCHGELARLRPPSGKLTSFYLCISAGGALGGLFVGLVAPHMFPAPFEYPIAFVACPTLLLIVFWMKRDRWTNRRLMQPFWMGSAACTVLLSGFVCHQTWREVGAARLLSRNFYGALCVEDYNEYRENVRRLSHGTITHGVEFLRPEYRHRPTTYYARNSGIGLTWHALAPAGPLKMGVVGLGAGTLAAYGRGGDTLRFYDINPLVVDIARTQFTFLSDCPAHIDIVLGDARLSLAHEQSQQFDILVVDAFSGDAIPVHLLTREAFGIYWRHLKPHGVLAVHVSNRYLDLAPVVALASRDTGKQVWMVDNDDDEARQIFASTYVLVSSRPNFFTDPLFKNLLEKINIPANLHPWTDDYSNLWQVLNYTGVTQ